MNDLGLPFVSSHGRYTLLIIDYSDLIAWNEDERQYLVSARTGMKETSEYISGESESD